MNAVGVRGRFSQRLRVLLQAITASCLAVALGCAGGGTGGTDGGGGTRFAIIGKTLSDQGRPLPRTTVTVLETGDVTLSNDNGAFSFATNLPDGSESVTLEVSNQGVVASARVSELPPEIDELDVDLSFSPQRRTVRVTRKEIKKRRKPTPTATAVPTPAPDQIPGPDDGGSPAPTPPVLPTQAPPTSDGRGNVVIVPFFIKNISNTTTVSISGSSSLARRVTLALPDSEPNWLLAALPIVRKGNRSSFGTTFGIAVGDTAQFTVNVARRPLSGATTAEAISLYLNEGPEGISLFSPVEGVTISPPAAGIPASLPTPPESVIGDIYFRVIPNGGSIRVSSLSFKGAGVGRIALLRVFPPDSSGAVTVRAYGQLRALTTLSSLRVVGTATDSSGIARQFSQSLRDVAVSSDNNNSERTVQLELLVGSAADGSEDSLRLLP